MRDKWHVIFILPTGTRPGDVLQVGDTFRFAGHIMPTLNSHTIITLTGPGGEVYTRTGQANHVGYFYNPGDDIVVTEPGLWSVDVRVWHDGLCSGGLVNCDPEDPFDPSRPCPVGDVLGSQEGRYWFYMVPGDSPRLDVSSPVPGFLSFDDAVTPITITGTVPEGLSGFTVDYTISMPGTILKHGRVTDTYQIVFDPVALHQDFPNLLGRDDAGAGLADTFAIGLLLQGQSGDSTVYLANTLTIQGEQVFVGDGPAAVAIGNQYPVYLPAILRLH